MCMCVLCVCVVHCVYVHVCMWMYCVRACVYCVCVHVCIVCACMYCVRVHVCIACVCMCVLHVCACVYCVCMCVTLTVSVEVISNHPITPGKVSLVTKADLSIHMLCVERASSSETTAAICPYI